MSPGVAKYAFLFWALPSERMVKFGRHNVCHAGKFSHLEQWIVLEHHSGCAGQFWWLATPL
jgi:hypothetical protein